VRFGQNHMSGKATYQDLAFVICSFELASPKLRATMAPKLPKDEDHFRQVWDGDSETDCVEICRDLQKAGIEYRTDQQPVSRSSRMGVDWKFKVYVLASDYQTATRALGPVEETESDDSVLEIEEKTGRAPG
jgi:hypothetical protein